MQQRRIHQRTVNRQVITAMLEQVRSTLKTTVTIDGKGKRQRQVALAAWAAVGIMTLMEKQQYRKAQQFLADVCTQPVEELTERCAHAYEAGSHPTKREVAATVQVIHDNGEQHELTG